MSDETIVAAIDPGLITGICIVGFGQGEGCTLHQSRELEYDELLPWALVELGGVDAVALERFTITPQTGKNTQAPWSLMGIGVITSVLALSDRAPVLQLPANAMNLVSNDMLRRLDLWHRGGAGHANDALRHAVLYAVKNLHWRDPRLVAPV